VLATADAGFDATATRTWSKARSGIPADALSPILQMLIATQLKFVLLRGSKFRYRSACLTGLRLEMKLDEDDMPADAAT
jgi:hypothetical protein